LFLFELLSLPGPVVFVVAQVGAVSSVVFVKSRLRAIAALPMFIVFLFLSR